MGSAEPLSPGVEELGDELPSSWRLAAIRDLVTVFYGKGLKGADRVGGEVPVFGSNGVVGWHNRALTDGPAIIIGRKGSVGAVHLSQEPCWPIDTTYFIDRFEGLDQRFLVYALRLLNLSRLDTSTAVPGLNREDLYSQAIPVPPLSEQRRIVAKVEALLARVNAARDRLTRVPTILKRFRQSVLAAACSGRLTEDCRTADFRALPPGGGPGEIQETWQSLELGELGVVTTGNTPSKAEDRFYGGPIPFFKPTDLDAGYWVGHSADSLTPEGAANARVLPPLSVMVTCIGATIGKTGLSRVAGATNQQINSVTTNPERVLPQYLFFYFQSPAGQQEVKGRASETTLPILNKGRFCKIPVPVPPSAEQHQIVRRVEALFALADTIEQHAATALRRADRLTQSILSKAFRGELVPVAES